MVRLEDRPDVAINLIQEELIADFLLVDLSRQFPSCAFLENKLLRWELAFLFNSASVR